jgi:phosphate transport system substrate-binding protein
MKKLIRPVLATLLLSTACYAQAADLTGAGSSFAQPVISKWADAYSKSDGARINYQSIGSAAGIKQIEAKTVDFGASDAPMMPAELDAAGLVQFPIIIGGIVPVINVPGIKAGQMKLTGSVLADIYLGKLTKWNDPEIATLNPGLKLPDTSIAVVRRADGSGTTFNFTDYLSKVSPDWKSKVGEGTTVSWPVGTGGKGNEGVSLYVQRLQGAIGYVEYAYAKQSNMDFVLVQNSSGNYPLPDEKSFQAAAAGADWEKNRYYVVITNQSGKDAWPISASTFVMMQKTQEKPAQGAEVLKFFDWAFNKGQTLAAQLDYVPLPPTLVKSISDSWARELKDSSGKALSLK